MKAPELILQMLSQAIAAGHTAKYVLFDSWFATPKGIMDIKDRLHMDVIAMVKKSGKVYYEYDGEQHDVKEIFSRSKKRRGRSKYLLSVEVNLLQKKYGKILERIPAKLVYVRNKANKKDWIAIICTDTTLSEEEIIKRYGYRWNILCEPCSYTNFCDRNLVNTDIPVSKSSYKKFNQVQASVLFRSRHLAIAVLLPV
jgi:hypothetical protein